MGRLGAQPHRALTQDFVDRVSISGSYGDGGCLYLVVDPSGARRWVLRVVVQGKRRDIGLGGARLFTLEDARADAVTLRKIARSGGDPVKWRAEKRAKGE